MSRYQAECAVCGGVFEAQRRTARYCSEKCRKRRLRAGGPRPEHAPSSGIVEATEAELATLGKTDALLGQQALVIAERLTRTDDDTGSAVASLSRELSRLMATLGAGKAEAADPVDEVRRRREQKRSRAAQA